MAQKFGSLEVREMRVDEVHLRVDYFLTASDEHLQLMGVDRAKLPDRKTWLASYEEDYQRPIEERRYYHLLWLLDDEPTGFCSTDRIVYGDEAFMHLHIMKHDQRSSGYGTEFIRRSVAAFFEVLRLQRLYCEPYAFNAAPNRAVQKAGFKYLFTHKTTPGPLNFHQTINRWVYEPNSVQSP